MKVTTYLYIFSVLFTSLVISQEIDSTETIFQKKAKHQIGIGASQFIKVVFNSDESAYTINYRRFLKNNYALRLGLSYLSDTDENASTEGGLRVGVDKTFKKVNNWEFYYGADLLTNFEKFRSSNREAYKIGAGPILGIAFYISPNFSLSIEPLFLFQYNVFIDNETFGDKQKDSFVVGFKKIGLVNLNFTF